MLKEDTLSNYKKAYQIEWANTLPENCPPEHILIPEEEEFYRLILNKDHIVEEDWKTYSELFPDKKYPPQLMSLASGLSLTKNGDFKELKKLPIAKRHKGIAKIKLNPTDGVLQKTGNDNNHYTWWRTTSFDPDTAEIIQDEKA